MSGNGGARAEECHTVHMRQLLRNEPPEERIISSGAALLELRAGEQTSMENDKWKNKNSSLELYRCEVSLIFSRTYREV